MLNIERVTSEIQPLPALLMHLGEDCCTGCRHVLIFLLSPRGEGLFEGRRSVAVYRGGQTQAVDVDVPFGSHAMKVKKMLRIITCWFILIVQQGLEVE